MGQENYGSAVNIHKRAHTYWIRLCEFTSYVLSFFFRYISVAEFQGHLSDLFHGFWTWSLLGCFYASWPVSPQVQLHLQGSCAISAKNARWCQLYTLLYGVSYQTTLKFIEFLLNHQYKMYHNIDRTRRALALIGQKPMFYHWQSIKQRKSVFYCFRHITYIS